MTLTDYHERLVDGIRTHFGDSLQTVQAYFPDWQSDNLDSGLLIDTPAALVEIERLEAVPEDGRGDSTDAVLCHVAIHCVLGSQTQHLQRELRNFAAAVLSLVSNRGLVGCNGVGEAESAQAMPGVFRTGQAGYDSFVVVFQQIVFIGDNIWQPTATPQAVYFRHSVNEQHLGDYEAVA